MQNDNISQAKKVSFLHCWYKCNKTALSLNMLDNVLSDMLKQVFPAGGIGEIHPTSRKFAHPPDSGKISPQ